MGYYTITDGGPDQGQYDNYEEALDKALDYALTQAADEGIDDDLIDTFENGTAPGTPGEAWESGACPKNHDGAYWPHVEWRD